MKKLFVSFALVCLMALPSLAVAQQSYEIVRADYGWGNNWIDVTERVRSLVQGNNLNFTVGGSVLGAETRRGRNRVLRIELKDGRGRTREVSYRENQQVNLRVNQSYSSNLHINRAIYASGSRTLDVTSRLNSQIQNDQLNMQVSNQTMGGDPAPGNIKTLTVDYTANGRTGQNIVREGEMLRIAGSGNSTSYSSLQITNATYGTQYRKSDVTARLNSQITNNQLNMQVNSDSMGGDPAPGRAKTLMVRYTSNGRSDQVTVNDGDVLRLPGSNAGSSSLQISRATYGSAYRNSDVTNRIASQIQNGQLNLRVNNDTMGGDPSPNQAKTLTVQYVVNGLSNQVVVNEGDILRLPSTSVGSASLQISRATYGSAYRNSDVTNRIASQIQNDQLNLRVNNDTMGGDPSPNQAKTLTVQYMVNGLTNQVIVNEGDMLRLPSNTTSRDFSQNIRCESLPANGNTRQYCSANTRGGVRLVRQISNTQCTQGTTWGYDNNGIWVDKGCRAEFELQSSSQSSPSSPSTAIANGTEISIRTNEMIDSKNTNPGQTFSAIVAADVVDNAGAVIVPKGSDVRLVIRSADGGSITSASELVLDMDSLTVRGTRYLVSTNDLSQQGGQGIGANKKTAIMVGGGTAIGTLIGAIVGGGKGAAIGAAIGAGAGAGTQILTRGKQVQVPAETLLNFRLDQEVRLQVSR